ncbi:Proposed lipoate regulatory protein YbeD [uncultured Candidatus Thioglobus sp.]|nr:Proposed lipoate regulatory protein YbeD [uncultured Candidatus Thioglobus sp.]SMM99711.1 Proposed lipoate regulatory protein YbeD [uncultured Candidatus Thioglobus sp.]
MNKSNSKPTTEEIFNFPCDYPIKVMGKDCRELPIEMCAIIERHAGEIHPSKISSRKSTKGSYISYTVRIIATSVSQLNSINKELQDHHLVAYIL